MGLAEATYYHRGGGEIPLMFYHIYIPTSELFLTYLNYLIQPQLCRIYVAASLALTLTHDDLVLKQGAIAHDLRAPAQSLRNLRVVVWIAGQATCISTFTLGSYQNPTAGGKCTSSKKPLGSTVHYTEIALEREKRSVEKLTESLLRESRPRYAQIPITR